MFAKYIVAALFVGSTVLALPTPNDNTDVVLMERAVEETPNVIEQRDVADEVATIVARVAEPEEEQAAAPPAANMKRDPKGGMPGGKGMMGGMGKMFKMGGGMGGKMGRG